MDMPLNRAAVLCLIFLLVTSQTMFFLDGSRYFKYRVQTPLGMRTVSVMAAHMQKIELPRRMRQDPYGMRRADAHVHF